jgi:hypothetical protein
MMGTPPIPTKTTHATPGETANTACIQMLSEPRVPSVAPGNLLLRPDCLTF